MFFTELFRQKLVLRSKYDISMQQKKKKKKKKKERKTYQFLCLPEGQHVVAALFVRPSIARSSIICLSRAYLLSNVNNLMKLDTLIESLKKNSKMREP